MCPSPDRPLVENRPQTRYARSGDINIAYQVVGDENAPLDLVFVPGWISNVEYTWEDPRIAYYLGRLASFSRLILFDKRGTGLSDRTVAVPNLEERMDDVRAVMDAVSSKQAALMGVSEGGVRPTTPGPRRRTSVRSLTTPSSMIGAARSEWKRLHRRWRTIPASGARGRPTCAGERAQAPRWLWHGTTPKSTFATCSPPFESLLSFFTAPVTVT